jgi:hypothetical protein
MQIDWAAMLASEGQKSRTGDAAMGCNRVGTGYVVRDAVTKHAPQSIDSDGQTETCNRVTAVTATFEEPKGSTSSALEKKPGGGGLCAFAPANKAAIRRPVLDYGLTDRKNNSGRMIGAPGDALADLVRDLRARYGKRLAWITAGTLIRARFSIVECDGQQTGRSGPERMRKADNRAYVALGSFIRCNASESIFRVKTVLSGKGERSQRLSSVHFLFFGSDSTSFQK